MEPAESPRPWFRRPVFLARVSLVGIVVVGLLLAQQRGLFHIFADPRRAKEALLGLGARGYVAFVVAYALLQPFGMPGTVFVLAAPLIWPWPVAFALSMVGTMAASVIGFSFARFVARDWFSKRIPQSFHAWDAAIARRGFVTVATLRFIFWMPQALHAFLGLSRVSFWTHFWGSLVGYIVPLWACAYFGERLFSMLSKAPPMVWAGVAAGWIIIVSTIWYVRRRRASAKASRVQGRVP